MLEVYWLFCNSVKGVYSTALIYALAESAKANNLEPYNYLLSGLSYMRYFDKTL